MTALEEIARRQERVLGRPVERVVLGLEGGRPVFVPAPREPTPDGAGGVQEIAVWLHAGAVLAVTRGFSAEGGREVSVRASRRDDALSLLRPFAVAGEPPARGVLLPGRAVALPDPELDDTEAVVFLTPGEAEAGDAVSTARALVERFGWASSADPSRPGVVSRVVPSVSVRGLEVQDDVVVLPEAGRGAFAALVESHLSLGDAFRLEDRGRFLEVRAGQGRPIRTARGLVVHVAAAGPLLAELLRGRRAFELGGARVRPPDEETKAVFALPTAPRVQRTRAMG